MFYVRREKGLGMANRAGVDECPSKLGPETHKIQLFRVENIVPERYVDNFPKKSSL